MFSSAHARQLSTMPITHILPKEEPEEEEAHLQEVLPYLFIGDIVAAQSPEMLSAAGITRLIDLSNMFPGANSQRVCEVTECDEPVASRLEVHVEDVATEDISWAFDACNTYIDRCKDRGETVMVHCFQVRRACNTKAARRPRRAAAKRDGFWFWKENQRVHRKLCGKAQCHQNRQAELRSAGNGTSL